MASFIEDRELEVNPELERIWNEDENPTFTEIRSGIENTEEEETENTEDEETENIGDEEPSDNLSENGESVTETEHGEEEAQKGNPTEPETDDYHTIKANGMQMKFTLDEIKALASKGMDYTKKTMALSKWRKTISALEEKGLDHDHVNMLIDAMGGNKEAIATMLKNAKIDPLDLDTENVEYIPNDYGRDQRLLDVEDVVNSIVNDKDYETTRSIVDDLWDSESRKQMIENPSLIKGLHEEVQMGRYDIIAPVAMKMKTMDIVNGNKRLSDLEYYQIAVHNYIESQGKQEAQQRVETSQADIQQKAGARKAASPTKKLSGSKPVIDYLDEDEDKFEEWLKQVKSRY